MYAVQYKTNGSLVDLYPTLEDASAIFHEYPNIFEIVDTDTASSIRVEYIEISTANSYGHQEVSFETYGGIIPCLNNFYKWVLEECKIFGPDYRDIKDYFNHCSVYVNSINKTKWFQKEVAKMNKNNSVWTLIL